MNTCKQPINNLKLQSSPSSSLLCLINFAMIVVNWVVTRATLIALILPKTFSPEHHKKKSINSSSSSSSNSMLASSSSSISSSNESTLLPIDWINVYEAPFLSNAKKTVNAVKFGFCCKFHYKGKRVCDTISLLQVPTKQMHTRQKANLTPQCCIVNLSNFLKKCIKWSIKTVQQYLLQLQNQ